MLLLTVLAQAPDTAHEHAHAPAPSPSHRPSAPQLPQLPPEVHESVNEGVNTMWQWVWPFLVLAGSIVAAFLLTWLVKLVLHRFFTSHEKLHERVSLARVPVTILIASIASLIILNAAGNRARWLSVANYLLPMFIIASVAWIAVIGLGLVETAILYRFHGKVKGARRLARLKTQVTLLKRVVTAVIVTIAVAAILLLIPSVRALGAGVLASAGLVSVVAGLALQSSLSNVVAGLQLALTDAIRVDDYVAVAVVGPELQLGKVEEVTLTYVVLVLFDDRRLILPSTYFTSTPFENWSRRGTQLLGTVFLDVDWTIDVDSVRKALSDILHASSLWDKRTGKLVMTDATGGGVQIRALVSARNTPDLWDLRCLVREKLVDFITTTHPGAIPKQRLLGEGRTVENGIREVEA